MNKELTLRNMGKYTVFVSISVLAVSLFWLMLDYLFSGLGGPPDNELKLFTLLMFVIFGASVIARRLLLKQKKIGRYLEILISLIWFTIGIKFLFGLLFPFSLQVDDVLILLFSIGLILGVVPFAIFLYLLLFNQEIKDMFVN